MIRLQQVVPTPIKDNYKPSMVWGTDFTFAQKRYLVTAPSGKGKSTLQHVLYGLRSDYSGQILIDDADIQSLSLAQWAEVRQQKLAIIFQDLRLFLDRTTLENIQLKNRLTDYYTEAEIHTMATRLGIEHLLQQSCGTLSYGQRQRVAIIRALCQPFSMLLMDEPFSHLDAANIEAACALLDEACTAQKAGFILASLGERYNLSYDEEVEV